MIEVADQAKARGCFLIAMTMAGTNRLCGRADLALSIPAVERVYRSAAELSRLSQLAAIDILFNVIISYDIDGAIAALERSMQATHGF
jgi:DNA-binding MurR/RpiR family transcriptional regulator